MERKVKYDYAFKLECVKLVLEKHYSRQYVSKLKNLDESSIRMWVNFYNKFGEKGLFPRKYENYPIDFKLKVLKRIKTKSLSIAEACLEFNIPTKSTIMKWQNDFTNFGIEGLQVKPKGRPKSMSNFKRKKRKSDKALTREEELMLELEKLRCENELLKKLHALVQARKNQKP